MDIRTAETFHQERVNSPLARTVAGIGPGGWDSGKLAREQEANAHTCENTRRLHREHVAAARPDASSHDANAIYRIYTEQYANVLSIVARYFDGASMSHVTGLWKGVTELSVVVEIIGTVRDREQLVALCEDIRATNAQHTVLATMQTARSLDSIIVTAPSVIGSADVVGV